ncbi:MAG: sigma 54-interacting transcriptional regulator [Chitinispirillaceae bacterium]
MAILLSFIAVNNDKDHGNGDLGPNLNLFRHKEFRTDVTRAVFLHRDNDDQNRTFDYLKNGLKKIRGKHFEVTSVKWDGDDPTDHKLLFSEIRKALRTIDDTCRHQEPLWIHISPGTPSMHAVWLLLAETGGISGSFKLFQSYRLTEKTAPRDIDIHSEVHSQLLFHRKGSDDRVLWEPEKCRSDKLKKVFEKAAMMLRLNVPILLLGERGTGKTTLAQWIRNRSPFSGGKLKEWPVIACGQYSEQLMASELFGHKKGSFTGAYSDKEGILSLLDGDTLFLDEIGDISPTMQRLLIRAVEEKKFTPLGGSETCHSSFRLISATNLPLDILQDKLHPDFFDRISAFILEMPPLGEICDELDWLWPQVFDSCRQKAQLPGLINLKKQEHEYVTEYLRTKAYSLPGNLRDLAKLSYHILGHLSSGKSSCAAVKHAVEEFQSRTGTFEPFSRKGNQNSLTFDCFPDGISEHICAAGEKFFLKNLSSDHILDSTRIINQVRKGMAEAAMKKSGNNKREAARLLGLKDGKSVDSWLEF